MAMPSCSSPALSRPLLAAEASKVRVERTTRPCMIEYVVRSLTTLVSLRLVLILPRADNDDEDGSGGEGAGETDVAAGDDGEELVDGSMQLAWEALEVGRVIFHHAGKTDELAQVYMKLGEHGQMREDYKQALEDFHESLRLRETIAKPNDRELAEMYVKDMRWPAVGHA